MSTLYTANFPGTSLRWPPGSAPTAILLSGRCVRRCLLRWLSCWRSRQTPGCAQRHQQPPLTCQVLCPGLHVSPTHSSAAEISRALLEWEKRRYGSCLLQGGGDYLWAGGSSGMGLALHLPNAKQLQMGGNAALPRLVASPLALPAPAAPPAALQGGTGGFEHCRTTLHTAAAAGHLAWKPSSSSSCRGWSSSCRDWSRTSSDWSRSRLR